VAESSKEKGTGGITLRNTNKNGREWRKTIYMPPFSPSCTSWTSGSQTPLHQHSSNKCYFLFSATTSCFFCPWVCNVPGELSTGIKRLGREADHSPAFSAEVKNAWSYTPTSPICIHGMDNDNFIFTMGL
jgi:hypothetical protein